MMGPGALGVKRTSVELPDDRSPRPSNPDSRSGDSGVCQPAVSTKISTASHCSSSPCFHQQWSIDHQRPSVPSGAAVEFHRIPHPLHHRVQQGLQAAEAPQRIGEYAISNLVNGRHAHPHRRSPSPHQPGDGRANRIVIQHRLGRRHRHRRSMQPLFTKATWAATRLLPAPMPPARPMTGRSCTRVTGAPGTTWSPRHHP